VENGEKVTENTNDKEKSEVQSSNQTIIESKQINDSEKEKQEDDDDKHHHQDLELP